MAQTVYYLDGSIVSATLTGSGTIGDPYGKTDDLYQAVLNTITRDTTNGDRLINTAGSVNQTAPIDLTTYTTTGGNGNANYPLTIDGGSQRTAYDLGGTALWVSSAGAYRYIHIMNFDFSNTPLAATIFDCASGQFYVNNSVAVSTGTSAGYVIDGSTYARFHGNKFTNVNRTADPTAGGPRFNFTNDNEFQYNFINFHDEFGQYGFYPRAGTFANNVIEVTGTNASSTAVISVLDGSNVLHNTLYCNATITGTWRAFQIGSSAQYHNIVNNYLEGFTQGFNFTAGSETRMFAGNKGFNVSTLVNGTPAVATFETGNEILTESGLVDAASGDYNIKSTILQSGFNFTEIWPFETNKPVGAYFSANILPKTIRDIY